MKKAEFIVHGSLADHLFSERPVKTTKIKLSCFGIVIYLNGPPGKQSGTLHSDLHEKKESNQLMAAIDALESIILAHACEGIDVKSPAYVCGIEIAANSIERKYA
jgi:hypothetical protein